MANKRRLRVVCHLQELMDKKAEELDLTDARFGFSQQKMSLESGVSPTTIRRILVNAPARIDLKVTEILMNYFDCEFSDLYTIELEKNEQESGEN